jgi:peptide/nickel transport system permease protein
MTEPSFVHRFARNRGALAGLAFLLLLFAVATLGPWLHPGDPMSMQSRPFLWPGERLEFPLGTDQLGRDVLSGLIAGSRISMGVGLMAALSTILIGLAVGGAAGGSHWLVDDALMRLTEVFQTIPAFVFVIVLVAILTPTLSHIVLAIALVSWPAVARIVRAEMLSLRSRDFVASCQMIGMSRARIIITQMLPNCLGPVIVLASMLVAIAILTEAALSFLGLSDANVMSWGRMIGNGRSALRQDWYLVALPGLAIIATVLALNLVGEGINDALNPRLRDG